MAVTIPLRGDRIPDGYPSVIKVVKVTAGCDTAGVDVVSSSQATYGLATIPVGACIVDIGWRIAEGFTNSVTLEIGDTGDSNGWANATDFVSTAAMTHIKTASEAFLDGLNESIISSAAGDTTTASTVWAVPAYAAPQGAPGKAQLVTGTDGPQTLELTIGGADPTEGKIEIYVYYHMAYGQKST